MTRFFILYTVYFNLCTFKTCHDIFCQNIECSSLAVIWLGNETVSVTAVIGFLTSSELFFGL